MIIYVWIFLSNGSYLNCVLCFGIVLPSGCILVDLEACIIKALSFWGPLGLVWLLRIQRGEGELQNPMQPKAVCGSLTPLSCHRSRYRWRKYHLKEGKNCQNTLCVKKSGLVVLLFLFSQEATLGLTHCLAKHSAIDFLLSAQSCQSCTPLAKIFPHPSYPSIKINSASGL